MKVRYFYPRQVLRKLQVGFDQKTLTLAALATLIVALSLVALAALIAELLVVL